MHPLSPNSSIAFKQAVWTPPSSSSVPPTTPWPTHAEYGPSSYLHYELLAAHHVLVVRFVGVPIEAVQVHPGRLLRAIQGCQQSCTDIPPRMSVGGTDLKVHDPSAQPDTWGGVLKPARGLSFGFLGGSSQAEGCREAGALQVAANGRAPAFLGDEYWVGGWCGT